MNARYYDPALGTFLSPDTLVPDAGAVIDYNRYKYARNNPLRYSDPTGHRECDLDCQIENESTNERDIHFGESYAGDCWAETCQPDEPAAIAVGIGVNGDALAPLDPLGVAGTGGIEFLAHKNGEMALYIYGGPGVSIGGGANAKVYVGKVYNLQDVDSYKGPFEVTDMTASLGTIGLTAGRFSAPFDEDGAYGHFLGYAPGADLSVSQSLVNYTAPLVSYNSKTNELSSPQFNEFVNLVRWGYLK